MRSSRSPQASKTPTISSRADKGRFVLTLYERLPAEELPFYLNLMAHLARSGVQAPAPQADRSGALWSFLNGKPAGLVTRLDGAPMMQPDAEHCAAAGEVLGPDAPRRRGLSRPAVPIVAVPDGGVRLRARCALFFRRSRMRCSPPRSSSRPDSPRLRLPRGAIHGDLFCDNVLFDRGKVSGVIDFGFAATDALCLRPCDCGQRLVYRCRRRGRRRARRDPSRRHGRAYAARARAERRRSARHGRYCCARRRFASGCRDSTTSTCRAPAS